MLQIDVDSALKRLGADEALINCSAGRVSDEQHCWFAGHLLKSKNLVIEYDYLLPFGPGRPKPSGWLQLKKRLFQQFGYHVLTLHKCNWDSLTEHQRDEQLTRALSSFRKVLPVEIPLQPRYDDAPWTKTRYRKKIVYDKFPPDARIV